MAADTIASTPAPPYYAVIFTSVRNKQQQAEYAAMAEAMVALAAQQEGFLGIESARENVGISVSYWQSLEAIRAWKLNTEHLLAQQYGREKWYDAYKTRICYVERDYGFETAQMPKILVLCTGNSCRSQMAEGYLRYFAGQNALVYSAGIETHGLNPKAVQVMKEDGIGISKHQSNHIDEYRHIDFDMVITVCDHAKEHCPHYRFGPQTLQFHHNFPDPAKATGTQEEIEAQFRHVRNSIKAYCKQFVADYVVVGG